MGFTLIHRKDGKEIPIKMSIWDAFHGAPNPRPRKPTPCKCCGKMHAPKRVNNDAMKFDGKKGGDGDGGKGGDDGKSHSYSTSPAVDWTPEDDALMLAIKAAKPDAPWTDIQAACGGKGSKSTIAERLKFLRDNSGKADGEKSEEEKKKGEESKANGEKKKAENFAKQDEEGKAGKKKKGKGKGQAEEQKDGPINGKKHKGGNDVKAWADGFEKKKWVAVASKHYDKTGERITAEQARKMAEEKS